MNGPWIARVHSIATALAALSNEHNSEWAADSPEALLAGARQIIEVIEAEQRVEVPTSAKVVKFARRKR